MAHRSKLCVIVVDVPSERRDDAVAFWSGAVGKELRLLPHPEYHGARLNEELVLLVQGLGDGDARMHVDIHTDDVAAEVARLQGLGATVVERLDEWTVMRDPVGLVFCVVEAPVGSLEDTSVQHWP
jgi:hypothetical protein